VCALEGVNLVQLIPHVYRQEMYLGQEFGLYDSQTSEFRYYKAADHESPINLFSPDLHRYPNFRFVETHYTVTLMRGDCLYIPAYYFFQLAGESEVMPQVGEFKPSAITMSMLFEASNELTDAFFAAIDDGSLK